MRDELAQAIRQLEKLPEFKGMGQRKRTPKESAAICAKIIENRDAALKAAGFEGVGDTLEHLERNARKLQRIWSGATELKVHVRQIGDTREFEGEFEIKGKLCNLDDAPRHDKDYDPEGPERDIQGIAADMVMAFYDGA
ncbi:MAG: hypothetical protein K8T25_18065 [Planctomycetia bacterium]|nr:hypothetical protein [Planctomycetia bacterium]